MSELFQHSVVIRVVSYLALLAIAVPLARGADKGADSARARQAIYDAEVVETQTITDELKSGDAQKIQAAVDKIQQLFHADPTHAANRAAAWLLPLSAAQQFQVAADMALQVVLRHNRDLDCGALAIRTRALLSLGQNDLALSEAKRYFMICQLKNTADALSLVANCLRSAHPGDRGLIERFKLEQIEGAALPTGDAMDTPATPAAGKQSVLAEIKVDPEPYLSAAQADKGEDMDSLLNRAELYQLAGRPDEARPLYEDAYDMAQPGQMATLTEHLASVLKAKDLTIGRANAYVRSLAPAATQAGR
jgi:tetratricopeptide (TPR) repeat protein